MVTTYGVLAAECGAEGPLLQVRWWRVVLDEAHSIKGRGTVAHRAAVWPCRIGDVGGHRMRTGSNLENPSTTRYAE